MGPLEVEVRAATRVLLMQGHSRSAVAGMPGRTNGTVRHHRGRHERGAPDRPARQERARRQRTPGIAHRREQRAVGRIDRAALYDRLIR